MSFGGPGAITTAAASHALARIRQHAVASRNGARRCAASRNGARRARNRRGNKRLVGGSGSDGGAPCRSPSSHCRQRSSISVSELRTRAQVLRERVLDALLARARAAGVPDPELRARTAFGLVAELSSTTGYELATEAEHAPMLRHLLELAISQF